MNRQITIEPIRHKGEDRVKLMFRYDDVLIGMVKNTPCLLHPPEGWTVLPQASAWSRTMKCWHVPKPENIVDLLKEYLPEINLEVPLDFEIKERDFQSIITETDRRKNIFYINLSYVLKDDFKKLEGAWWHPGARKWSAVDNPDNRLQLKSLVEKSGSLLLHQDYLWCSLR